jgi:hypothetical protein
MEGYGATAIQEKVMGGLENNNSGVQKAWAIICPGPSLSMYSEFLRDSGCLIAVNGAILQHPADYWAMIDEEVFDAVLTRASELDIGIHEIKSAILWIPEKWFERRQYGRISPMFDDFKKVTWKDLDLEMDIGYRWPWKTKTVYTAIALAIKKGAKTIRLYGADMAGEGYFIPGITNNRMEHGEMRWKDERVWMNSIIGLCRKNGIEVMRMMPDA